MNQQEQRHILQEDAFHAHHQIGEKPTRKPKMQSQLFCACGNGLKCEGICREQHLYRARYASPMIKTKAAKSFVPATRTQWADKCPESYEIPVKS